VHIGTPDRRKAALARPIALGSRLPAASDARRAVLTPTPAGRELLAGSHAWQEQAFARLTAGWDPEDAARFAGYLQRLESELSRGRSAFPLRSAVTTAGVRQRSRVWII
jgi:hypothetical protein